MPLRRHARTRAHTHTHTHSRHIPPRGVPQVYAFTHKHTHTCTHTLYTRNILLPLYLPGALHKYMPSHVHTYTHSIHKPAKGHLTSLRFYTHTHVHIPSIHIPLCTSEHPRVTRQVYTHTRARTRTLYTNLPRVTRQVYGFTRTLTHTHPHTLYTHNILLPPYLLKGQLAIYSSTHTHTHSLITHVPSYTHSVKPYGDKLNDVTSIFLYYGQITNLPNLFQC